MGPNEKTRIYSSKAIIRKTEDEQDVEQKSNAVAQMPALVVLYSLIMRTIGNSKKIRGGILL